MRAVQREVTMIDAGRHKVFLGRDVLQVLDRDLADLGPGLRTFIIGDENSLHHCMPELLGSVPRLQDAEVFSIAPGESSKSLLCAQHLWQELSAHAADRQALVLDLGGGVVSDLGGYVASTFKRGLRFMNVPTTLMGMVDAAIGGKNGIDLAGVKNLVGTFHDPLAVYIHVPFLRTLGKRELLNGVAEMIKHALVRDPDLWARIQDAPLHDMAALTPLIERSAEIKAAIVKEDPLETGQRKLLNFGHTIGHGIEAYSWEGAQRSLLHGEAVALGMICEAWLSWRMGLLERAAYAPIVGFLFNMYRPYPMDSTGHYRILELMRNDKKNSEGQFKVTLLSAIGQGQVDVRVTAAQVQEALEHYRALVQMNGRLED